MTITAPIYHWQPAAWLKVQGEDAFTFLQGQFTNDLRNLTPSAAVYGLWLNQKGRVLADSFIAQSATPGEFWVGSYFSPAALIRDRLESYVIADDVTVTDETSAWRGTTMVGPRVLVESLPNPGAIVFEGRRGLGEHREVLASDFVDLPGATLLNESDMTRTRIQAGIAAIPADIGPGELPNEGGLEAEAISYTKGCYLGQEVMARLKNLGQVRRRLVRVRGVGSPPAGPVALFQQSKRIGELRSTMANDDGFIGLALVTTMHLNPQGRLRLAPEGPDVAELFENP